MSELEMLAMFFIQIIVGLGILIFISAIFYCIGILLGGALTIIYLLLYMFLMYPVIESFRGLFWRIKDFFFQHQHYLVGFKLRSLKKQLSLFIQSIGHGMTIIYLENTFGLRMKECALNGIKHLGM